MAKAQKRRHNEAFDPFDPLNHLDECFVHQDEPPFEWPCSSLSASSLGPMEEEKLQDQDKDIVLKQDRNNELMCRVARQPIVHIDYAPKVPLLDDIFVPSTADLDVFDAHLGGLDRPLVPGATELLPPALFSSLMRFLVQRHEATAPAMTYPGLVVA